MGKGDGNCDDENNNKGCGYDGGDCCAKSVKGGQVKKNFCKMCKCVDPGNQSKGKLTCALPKYRGDGNCDDGTTTRLWLRWRRLLRENCERRTSEEELLQNVQMCRSYCKQLKCKE